MFKKVQILFITVILLSLSQVNAYAADSIIFLTPKDKEIYINIVNKASNQKKQLLIDKASFENIIPDQTIINKHINKTVLLYINSAEINNVLVQGSNNINGSSRRINMYSGIGLSKVGYDIYSKYFDDMRITYEEPSSNFLIIKPELLYFNYRYDERGKLKNELYININLVMAITVCDKNKEIFQKVYKASNIEIPFDQKIATDYAFSAVISKAINNIFNKNIKDIIERF